mgnify:CR=1 FL=1
MGISIIKKNIEEKFNPFIDIENFFNRENYEELFIDYYNDFYNVFSKTADVDLMLVKVDYKNFLINAQNAYNFELRRNSELNNKLITNSNTNIT